MVVVAVAGGTGKVGRTIAEAILAGKKHEVIILSRKTDPSLEAKIGARILPVDYFDVNALAQLFEEQHVHTVVSTINMAPLDGSAPPEVEIIRAAEKSKPTKRIISSDWGLPHTKEQGPQMKSAENKLIAQEELKKTNLEWTLFHIGFFLDFWAGPNIKTYMHPVATFIDIPHQVAAIPGSGDVPVAFTYSQDVARFVTASLDLDHWEPASFAVGDRVTWHEFVKAAEEVTGDKFNVTYDSVEKLSKGEVTELPGHVPAYAFVPKVVLQQALSVYALWSAEGAFSLVSERTLNDVFPEIKPMGVREMLQKAWGKQK
ncbi:hypothetical protein FDECE_6542 [Fusarium decemcellulare]|nr:hypothetical protein FDECE_6542 [Fusarium decemcellulare]